MARNPTKTSDPRFPNRATLTNRGLLKATRWLLLRRLSQIGILALFLLGPLADIWIIKGNLSASVLLETIPLTDPLLLLQSVLSGDWPITQGLIGAAIVLGFYALVGGRVFCAWVCPVNLVSDLAEWLRRRLDLRSASKLRRNTRYWMLGMVLLATLITGSIVWELINPVSMAHRGLIFGMGFAWLVLLAVFLFDLLMARHGWCGHLCPVGAFYGLIGRVSLVRVAAVNRGQCDDCNSCFHICPEPQVIKPALKGADKGLGPVILDGDCSNCGRCIDVCDQDVFAFGGRFQAEPKQPVSAPVTDH